MNSFSISQLSQLSGIKAHTIRIWEQRYNALTPHRSDGNTRYYDNSQLRRLLNIVSLMDEGYKISELCAMPDEKLYNLVSDIQNEDKSTGPSEYFISQLISAGMSYDEAHFEKVFAHCLIKYGMKETYIKVIYPTLLRMGLMWATGAFPPSQEHFNSNMIRLKLSTAIDSLPPPKSPTDTWLLFLPENEFHEISLLFSQYLIRLSGKRTIYLGGNLPFDSISDAILSTEPENLLFFLVHYNSPVDTQNYLDNLSSLYPDKNIFISGNTKLIRQLKYGKCIHWLESVEDLENVLKSENTLLQGKIKKQNQN
jgi:DNA-binding transcriptional MerR regulator